MDRKKFLTTSAARLLACGSVVLAGETTVLAQTQAVQRARRQVIPIQVIEEFRMVPAEGYGLWVLGEDGKPYSLDEVLSVLFIMLKNQWGGDQPKVMQKRMKP